MSATQEQPRSPNQAALDEGQELARAGEAAREQAMALETDLSRHSEELSAVGRHALQAAHERANEEFVTQSQEAASVLPTREEGVKLPKRHQAGRLPKPQRRELTPYGMDFEQFSEK